MTARTAGIHHVTAIAGNPQENIDFYAGLLGLRLVKLTVNFDDPGAYHLYYGDEVGHPGTIMTFFSWPGARRGRRGIGQVGATSLAVPPGSIGFWKDRLRSAGVRLARPVDEPERRFGDPVLAFLDPDGLFVELVASEAAEGWPCWQEGPVSAEHAIRGFHSVTLEEEGYVRTQELLTDTLGFEPVGQERQVCRFRAGEDGPGNLLDIRMAPNMQFGVVAVGTVHHVAWRAPDDASEQALQHDLARLGYNPTQMLDRQYFHSVYFREPGGVLFEIATEPPGFTVDESVEELGTHLKLPPWLEPKRAAIEQILPAVRLPVSSPPLSPGVGAGYPPGVIGPDAARG
jgi:catechol 2,3-dioxygenase-like lactoylglutathione lyase family enzyme